MLQSPVWPFQNLQSQMLGLRSRLLTILVELPSLVLHCSRIHERHGSPSPGDDRLDSLIHKASKIFDKVKKWITEAESLFFTETFSQRVIGHMEYPDIICGVLDCVANMALLNVNKMLHFLCHARLQSSSMPGRGRQIRLETSQLLDNQQTIEQRRQRAMTAFKFVQGQSELAAKPLDFGLRQIQHSDFGDSIHSRRCNELKKL